MPSLVSTTSALLLVLILASSVDVDAFNSHLSRPWDENSVNRRRRTTSNIRFYVSELEKSNEEGDKGDEEEEQDDKDQEESEKEESMALQEPEIPGSSSHVLSSGATVAATTSTAEANQSPLNKATVPEPVAETPKPTIKSCLPDLIAMTRPSNLPGVVLFHTLGTFLAIQSTGALFWQVLLSPGMMVTLTALLLTSSTSMLVNDYYDYKLEVDSNKLYKPLSSQTVPLLVVKRFLSYLYAAALLCVAMIPGAPARLSVVTGLMLTFWYTQHLKPRTWLKNAVCASLIALSPWTSGVAAMALTQGSSSGAVTLPLLRLVTMLFVGILGREITMDINDVQDDMDHGVQTVPVEYGRKFASAIGLICSLGVAGLALSGPLQEFLFLGRGTKVILRRLALAGLGSLAQIGRAWQVFESEGQNSSKVQRAVEEGLLSVVLLVVSFV